MQHDEPAGARTRDSEPGFLNDPAQAHLLRLRGRTERRLCRWCGAQMRWTGYGQQFMCTNWERSCDR